MKNHKIISVMLYRLIILFIFFDINNVSAMRLNSDNLYDYDRETHIGNLSRVDNRGFQLDDNLVNIGNRYWHVDEENIVSPEGIFGRLICQYSYYIDDSTHPFNGERVWLCIHDIDQILQDTGDRQDEYYTNIHNSLAEDTTTTWESTNDFYPFLALKIYPKFIYKGVGARFVIFANSRVYFFIFQNQLLEEKNGDNILQLFEKRCISVIKSIDLLSYHQHEIEEIKEKELQEEEENLEGMLTRIAYTIISISGIILFLLSLRTLGKKNTHARKCLYYIGTCMTIGILLMGVGVLFEPNKDDIQAFLILCFVPLTIINIVFSFYFNHKSKEEYEKYYLIPKWLSKNLNITNEFRTRLLMIFLIYPFFIIVPLPVVGVLFLVFYILPVLLILGITWIVLWVKEGKEMDTRPLIQNDKARLYCRHCGKLIDADSDYCRYCGKKL